MITTPPSNAVILRFGPRTPFWALTMSYGMFNDPGTRTNFISPDHYIGFHMLVDTTLRDSIMSAPNGYIAWRTLSNILVDTALAGAIDPKWASIREDVMREAVRLKFTQSTMVYDMLLRTQERPILDDSRNEERFWCYAQGRGENVHGKLLEQFRKQARKSDPRYAVRVPQAAE